MRNRMKRACAIGIFLPCVCAAADPIWQNSNYFTNTKATVMAESPFDFLNDSQGGNYSGLFPPRDDTYGANAILPDGDGESIAYCRLAYNFNGNILSVSASVSADVDPGDFMIGGTAESVSKLIVQFDLPAGGSYRIVDGAFTGTHASSGASLFGSGPSPIVSFGSLGDQPNGESGTLAPGGYTLEVGASADSNYLFFNGLFADASLWFDIEIIAASACPGDLNGDGFVDDSDFTIFVLAYNLLDCNDPAMTPGCPADFNADGFVEDADFILFVAAYDDLVCP